MQLPDLVLTPTARLARKLARASAVEMTAAGRTAWLPAPVLSFSAWLSQIRDDYFLRADDARAPITAHQALLLWQSLIDREVFIGEPQVAELAQRSWRLLHEHALDPPAQWPDALLSEDSRRFRDWADAYRRACRQQGLVDESAFAAEIPGLMATGSISVPATIELVGFDLPATPLQEKVLAACRRSGASLSRREAPGHDDQPPELFEFDTAEDEMTGAARWARQLLENDPQRSIAIVVPDLNGRVDQADRLLRETFDPPGFALADSAPEAWHLSLGKPLANWPLVRTAVTILSLSSHRASQPQIGSLLRSPYLAGWAEESAARSQTLAHLARRAPFDLTCNELTWALQQNDAHTLAKRLASWQGLRREITEPAWPAEWARRFSEELVSLGFAAGRTLDSREYQVLQRWHELLESYSTLDAVAQSPMPRQQALRLLVERAGAVVFRERDPGVSVEVLGVEEALGSHFDAVWITTLDSLTWPGSPQRDPLIPAAVQAAVPRASSEGCLAQAQLELAGLLAAAPLTCGSFARGGDETPLQMTALLAGIPVHSEPSQAPPTQATMDTPCADTQAPPLDEPRASGGTGVLRDQSSCPFRAFATRRLNAIDLTPPRPGLDAGQRGEVIHKALEAFWQDVEGRAELDALTEQQLDQRTAQATRAALEAFTRHFHLTLSAAGRLLEERRTQRVLLRWLSVERERGDFQVITHEHPITLQVAGLELTGKIDRLDQLADGSTMLIDYKTGSASKSDWFPEARMADPQLPAYAMCMDPQPSAIAFARIRPEDLKFDGLAAGDTETPGVIALASAGYRYKALDSWVELLDGWQAQLETLASDFMAGTAAVSPRRVSVCNNCHLHALCRIQERDPYDAGDSTDPPDFSSEVAGDD